MFNTSVFSGNICLFGKKYRFRQISFWLTAGQIFTFMKQYRIRQSERKTIEKQCKSRSTTKKNVSVCYKSLCMTCIRTATKNCIERFVGKIQISNLTLNMVCITPRIISTLLTCNKRVNIAHEFKETAHLISRYCALKLIFSLCRNIFSLSFFVCFLLHSLQL